MNCAYHFGACAYIEDGIFSVSVGLMFYIVVEEASMDPTDPEAVPPGEDAPPGEEAPPGAMTDAQVFLFAERCV